MATLQVRSIDDKLYEALGRKAALENRSISKEVISIIKAYLAAPTSAHQHTEDFLTLCGTWEDDRSPDEIIREIKKDRHSRKRAEGLV